MIIDISMTEKQLDTVIGAVIRGVIDLKGLMESIDVVTNTVKDAKHK